MAPEWGVPRDRWVGRQGESRFFAFHRYFRFRKLKASRNVWTSQTSGSRFTDSRVRETGPDFNSIWLDRGCRVEPTDTIIRGRKARSYDRTLVFSGLTGDL